VEEETRVIQFHPTKSKVDEHDPLGGALITNYGLRLHGRLFFLGTTNKNSKEREPKFAQHVQVWACEKSVPFVSTLYCSRSGPDCRCRNRHILQRFALQAVSSIQMVFPNFNVKEWAQILLDKKHSAW
jgi:hypothetical protein